VGFAEGRTDAGVGGGETGRGRPDAPDAPEAAGGRPSTPDGVAARPPAAATGTALAAAPGTAPGAVVGGASPAVWCSGISKRYGGVSAVNQVDLTLHDGEILGLIGPNGSGKTTLFDVISGLTPNNGGRVILEGRDVTDRPAHVRAALGLGRSL